MSKFEEILDRQLKTETEGESNRQACEHRGGKRERKGYGHKRSARRRMQSRMGR